MVTLVDLAAHLLKMLQDAAAGSEADWSVYEHEWVDGLHAPAVILGPAVTVRPHGASFTLPSAQFEVRLWVDPTASADSLRWLHAAIDKADPSSFLSRFEDAAVAAEWGFFTLTDNEIRTRSIALNHAVLIEAVMPVFVIPNGASDG